MKPLWIMLWVLATIGCGSATTEPIPDTAHEGLDWKEFTVESHGLKLSAMLPSDSKLTANDKFQAYVYRNSNPIFAIAVGIDVADKPDARYPVDDPEGEFADLLIDHNKKNGNKYEYVKRTKVNGITGTEALRLAKEKRTNDEDLSTISRVFYFKRTAVFARVLFDGQKPPDKIVRTVFDSLKIEPIGPYREASQ